MLKVNVTHVNFFLDQMRKAADRQEMKQAARYWLLSMHELRRQRHIAKASHIHDHMKTIMFKIEIDDAFETHETINN